MDGGPSCVLTPSEGAWASAGIRSAGHRRQGDAPVSACEQEQPYVMCLLQAMHMAQTEAQGAGRGAVPGPWSEPQHVHSLLRLLAIH